MRDQAQAQAYLAALFVPEDLVEVRAIDPARKMAPRQSWHQRDEPGLLADASAWNAEGYNVYVGICPRTRRGGAKAEDVALARCLWLDFDTKDFPGAPDEAVAFQAYLDARLGERPAVSVIVWTGHGLHYYWRLRESTAELDRVEALHKLATRATGADKQAVDRARIMRLPGTINHKPPVAEAYVIRADGPKHELPALAAWIEGLAPAHAPAVPAAAETRALPAASPAPFYDPTEPQARGAAPELSTIERARRWLAKRPPAIQGRGGDEWTFKTACALVRGFSLSDADAYPLLAAWNAACQPPWDERGLQDKLASARRNGKEPFGYLMNAERDRRGRLTRSPAGPPMNGSPAAAGGAPSPFSELRNCLPVVCVNEKGQEVTRYDAVHAETILAQVVRDMGDDWGRLGDNLFYAAPGPRALRDAVSWMPDSAALFDLLARRYRAISWKDGGMMDRSGINFYGRREFHCGVRASVRQYWGISSHPIEPPDERIWIRWEPPRDYEPDGSRLREFLAFFNPATQLDADLLAAYVLTLFWGGSPGSRPLFVITGAEFGQQGVGKSECARLCASLVGGTMELRIPKQGSFADGLSKQALEECNLECRVALLDNVTGTLRDDSLTDLVTAYMIEGRASYAKQAKRMNLVTWTITTNEPHMSSDIATRSVLIRLAPHDRAARPTWRDDVGRWIETHGAEVASDCLAILRQDFRHKITAPHTRFPVWDGAVLACLESVNECLEHIHRIGSASDSDADEIWLFLQALREKRGLACELKTKELCEVWQDALDRSFNQAQLGRILANAQSRGILRGLRRKTAKNGSPWLWAPNEIDWSDLPSPNGEGENFSSPCPPQKSGQMGQPGPNEDF